MKKINLILLILILIFPITLMHKNVCAKLNPPKVSADGAILMDATTGKILYSKNIDGVYPPASTTKIMTALLTLENCKLNDIVTVGKVPPKADGSKIYLNEGEKLSIKDLLYALLLESANDSAEALAEHISGSIKEFSNLMNKRAKELGCTHTNFVNPNGLYNSKHRTSAHDLALILKTLVNHPEFSKIAKTSSYKINPTNKTKKSRNIWNKNRLIQKNSQFYYPSCEGGKTGYTIQSFHSFVASSNKDGQRLIVALLHDKEKTFFKDSINLFNYGYTNFQLVKLYSAGDMITTYNDDIHNLHLNLLASRDFYYIKEKSSNIRPNLNIEKKDLFSTSFKKGDAILNMDISLDNKNIGSIKLLSDSDYPSSSDRNSKLYLFLIFITIFILILSLIISIKRKIKANN